MTYYKRLYHFFSLLLLALVAIALFGGVANADGLAIPNEQTPGQVSQACAGPNAAANCLKENPIVKWIDFGINLLSVVILVGSAIMIAFAGIQYSTARDNAQTVQAAKQKIWGVVIALLAYFFLYAIVQWLVPGGVF